VKYYNKMIETPVKNVTARLQLELWEKAERIVGI